MSGYGGGAPGPGVTTDCCSTASVKENPQLPLGLSLREGARFESYFPGQNGEPFRNLQLAAEGKGESLLYIAAAGGLGKTHLLQAACHHASRCQRSAAYLPMQQLPELTPAVFDGLEQMALVCLDDIHAVAGNAPWERALFDLFNRLRDSGSTLLVSAEKRPDRCGFGLADLVSRLGWGVTYVLKPLDDADVQQALTGRAAARGLELPEETAQFLLRRFPRDQASLFALFDTLDAASLVEQRRLTIPFVKSVLDR